MRPKRWPQFTLDPSDIITTIIKLNCGFAFVHEVKWVVYKKMFNYRIHAIWAPLLNRTPPIEYSNTTPVKNPVLGQKLAKIGKIAANF